MTDLRIALTLPGVASLGAFEGGAVAALVVALEHVNAQAPDAVRLDVIAGASSGALTAVLAARTLLTGADPLPILHRAWVTEPSLTGLRGRGDRAPLSLRRAREVAQHAFAQRGVLEGGAPQRTAVTVDMALASLRPLEYEIRRHDEPALHATSHLDWATQRLEPGVEGSPLEDWLDATDAALASASHPLAFAARRLDREAMRAEYERNGVERLPEPLELWYSDGGLIEVEPFGRCLSVAREVDEREGAPGRRLVLVVRPRPGLATDGEGAPCWTETLGHALEILTTHSLYTDLQRVEKTNARIRWSSQLVDVLAAALAGQPEVRGELERLLRDIDAEKTALGRHVDTAGATPPGEIADLLERALRVATGLRGKDTVRVELVSAGDSAGDDASLVGFGGFLDERLRERDFALGYAHMLAWLEDAERGPAALGLPAQLAALGATAAREHGAGLARGAADGPRRARITPATALELGRLGARVLRIVACDAWALRRRSRRAAPAQPIRQERGG